MPDEPSTPEICDRPSEKHEQLSATPGNLTLSRPLKGLLLPFVDDLRSQILPKKGLSGASAKLFNIRDGGDPGAARGAVSPSATPEERVLVLVPVRGGALDGLVDLGPGLEAAALERQRAQDFRR
jgi:hypothetical protein